MGFVQVLVAFVGFMSGFFIGSFKGFLRFLWYGFDESLTGS